MDGNIISLFGSNPDPGLVGMALRAPKDGRERISLYFRRGRETVREEEPFAPFLVADASRVDPGKCRGVERETGLSGGGEYNLRLDFKSWKDCRDGAKALSAACGTTPSAPGAPVLFINDPVRQHLTATGRTFFKDMPHETVRRMQLDIECETTGGYEFCNAGREGDRIVAVGLADETGWTEVLSCADMDEKDLLKRLFGVIRDRDPDVIEGHNIFNFDLSYIRDRAKLLGVKFAVGRDGSEPETRQSRLAMGDRQIAYTRFDIAGRHVADTMFLAQAYDLSERSLESFGLKEVAVHFGVAARDRTYIAGREISAEFRRNPGRVASYVRDDVVETRAVSNLLSPSYLVQAAMLPYSYQDVCVRGNATKIDALMVREYLRQDHSLPAPGQAAAFAGGYTDVFITGVARNVHHCDVRSLYPSLMLSRRIGPARDELGVFLGMLDRLRTYRLEARDKMRRSGSESDRNRWDATQRTFKILINSFYGYLGFAQGQFCDFDAAARVTADGRELLRSMTETLRKLGASPVEIDTDGIYFVPPPPGKAADTDLFRASFAATLPKGIEVEFDGEYEAMFSYKMKNYALLCGDGSLVIRGAALKSRGIEKYLRRFTEEMIRLKLQGRDSEIPALKESFESAIRDRKLPLPELAKTVTLQDSPATYAAKIGGKARGRDAAYELALKSGRDYAAGDQLSYYVTGSKKSVAAHENARLVSDADPAARDENVAYYIAKLDALYDKFYDVSGSDQAELQLE